MQRFQVILIFLSFVLMGCVDQHSRAVSWNQMMKTKLSRYGHSAQLELKPYFDRAKVSYPPKFLALLVFKKTKTLELYAKNQGAWKYIRTFPILAASGEAGPKLLRNDHQVPEGIYKIIGMNPKSRFDLSMHLNYPNHFDKIHAESDHRSNLGNNIYIHGKRRSIGCIAIGDAGIEQLFPLVYQVGEKNVSVIIAPNDLRIRKPIYGKAHPKWLNNLYADIKNALTSFPEPTLLSQYH